MSAQGKILIVDDISTYFLLLQTILQDEGSETESTTNPKTVVDLLLKKEFKLVLLVIMMPVMVSF